MQYARWMWWQLGGDGHGAVVPLFGAMVELEVTLRDGDSHGRWRFVGSGRALVRVAAAFA